MVSNLRVHCFRPLTDAEKGVLLALATVLPIHTFHACFTSPKVDQ